MLFSFENEENIYLLDTNVPNIFILEYLKNSDPIFIKQYLISLMHAQHCQELSKEELGEYLCVSLNSIDKGFQYWEEQGLLKRIFNDYGEYDIKFIKPFLKDSAIADKKIIEEQKRDSEEVFIQSIFKEIENIKGNPLSSGDVRFIRNVLKDTEGISPELLVYAYEIAILKNKSNNSYVSSILDSWVSNGIYTVSEAEREIEKYSNRSNNKKQILNSLGLRRLPTSAEDEILDIILDDFNLPLNEILDVSKKRLAKYRNPNVESLLNEVREEFKTKSEKLSLSIDDYYIFLRSKARDTYEKRKAELFREYPDIEDVYKNIEVVKYSLLDPANPNLEDLKKDYENLILKRDQMLKDRKLSVRDFMVPYKCSLCKDTGQLDDGNTCECYPQRMKELKSGIKY